MKNKIVLSLALLIAANTTTPASAVNFKQGAKIAGRAILATGKTAVGLAALGAAIALLRINPNNPKPNSIKVSGRVHSFLNIEETFSPTHNRGHGYCNSFEFSNFEILPALYTLVGITSLASGFVGYKALKSAWNDFKNINK